MSGGIRDGGEIEEGDIILNRRVAEARRALRNLSGIPGIADTKVFLLKTSGSKDLNFRNHP